MVFWRCLLSVCLWLRVTPTKADSWTANLPSSVVGLSGSCVVIPCTFNYPAMGKTYSNIKGIWYKGYYESTVYDQDSSKISGEFKNRVSLIGDLTQKNCSLKISSLRQTDNVKLMFRIEIENLDKFTYENTVSIQVKETPEQPSVSVEEELTSGKQVSATCAVSHSCPSDLPQVTWSHQGSPSGPSQPQDHGQWKLTSYSLTFTPSREDHNRRLNCTADFKGKTVTGYKTLNVKYPPYNVKVVTGPPVKENESVTLTCSSDSNPPANSYEWFSLNKLLSAKGSTYQLVKVSRHTEAISCTAINTEGRNSSDPQKLNILYPPEIRNESSCQSASSTVCVCIVDSNPPSEVKWFSPDSSKSFLGSRTEIKESLSIFTLEAWLGFPDTVQCFASNSVGSSSITLKAPQNGMVLYIAVASAVAVVLVVAGILVYAVRRRCGKRAVQQPTMHLKDRKSEIKTANKFDVQTYKNSEEEKCCDEDVYTNSPDNNVYSNWECEENAPSDNTLEDESIYANT